MADTGRRRINRQQDLWDRFWKDKHGQIVVWQRPSPLLFVWAALTVVSLFITSRSGDIIYYVAVGALVIWALLEIFKGVNYLRRLLGVVVLALIILALFKVGY